MKWEKLSPPELDEPMCCCECDLNKHGCHCDSEDLDEACKRWLKGRRCANRSRVLGSMIDRLEVSMVPALVLLPVLLRVAALHLLLGALVLTALPGLALWYYHATHRRGRRTIFFLTLSLHSLAYMYYLFLTEVLPGGGVAVARPQVIAVTTGVALTVASLVRTKRGPGFVRAPGRRAHQNGDVRSEGSASPLPEEPISRAAGGRCPVCKVARPPRAGHCRICGSCVRRLDHHCIWYRRINSCVGQANHRSFLLTLCLFLLTSLYGISLVLRSLCPHQNVITALFYCPGVYNQYSTAHCFTCAWYSSIVTGALLHLLVMQVLNISYNVTEREVQQALRSNTGRRRLFGLVVDTGENSRGFYHNWLEFLTMRDGAHLGPANLV